MDEIRKNNYVEMHFSEDKLIKGFVSDYTKNQITIVVAEDFIETAKRVKDLDNLILIVHTDYGIKKTYSCVTDALDETGHIIIENNPSVPVIQKREFVRISSNLNFKIRKGNYIYNCTCLNISGGGVAFKTDNGLLKVGDNVEIIFQFSNIEEEVIVEAVIHKVQVNKIVAKYINLNKYDESKIVKYVFRKSVKKPV